MIRARLAAGGRVRHGHQVLLDDDVGDSQGAPPPAGEPKAVDPDQSLTLP
jgi:hypothetical protein